MRIITERLTLRPALASDVEALHGILADPRAMAYWSTLPHATLDETRAWVESMIVGDGAGTGLDLVVEFEGRAIGKAGFWSPPEIGYILHPDCWGRGLGREALEAVIRAGFEQGGFTEIRADVDPRNLASLALLARFGFVRTGYAKDTWEIGGVSVDSVYLTLPRPQPAA